MFQMVPSSRVSREVLAQTRLAGSNPDLGCRVSQELLDDVIVFIIIIIIKLQIQSFDLLCPSITSPFTLYPSITRVQSSSEFSEATLLQTNIKLPTIVGREDRDSPETSVSFQTTSTSAAAVKLSTIWPAECSWWSRSSI